MNSNSRLFANETTENEIQWRTILEQQNIRTNFHLLRPLNPLSSSYSQTCDICSNPAILACISCHSKWCSHEHFLLDDEPVHSHICSKLTELWFIAYENKHGNEIEALLTNSSEMKIERGLLMEIRRICLERCSGYVADRNWIMAVAPSLRVVGLSEKIFGKRSLEFISAGLLMAKCHLGLKKYEYVNRHLQVLNVQIMDIINDELQRVSGQIDKRLVFKEEPKNLGENRIKFPFVQIPIKVIEKMNNEIVAVQGRLYHLFGAFFQSLGESEESIDFFGASIYFLSLAYGPTALKTTLGYLELGKSMLIGQKPFHSPHNPKIRYSEQNAIVKKVLNIVQFSVDVWDTMIRRAINTNTQLLYDFCEIGEPRLLLQDAKAISSLYVGTASSYYCSASVTLAFLFLSFDKDYESVVEAKIAQKALQGYFIWNDEINSQEYQRMKFLQKDVSDILSILETPDVMKRIAIVETNARSRV
ncbi:hypothetical protein SS50377_23072 [Spironucleus salmonicida]|uniref:MYND-type domain-containing protein n=1 Tax=Spironucleus salmonicida TaxID=348837 RepID=V6LSQ4_9EUKA|nr:hypothetical protein SS50377_23072 [Spironucleus salmonicida]|eukprot:EST47645.1 hypothetical protein SS50377_12340 [Spironucleus salmonicida]